MYLSKSKYCLLWQCPKLLWLDTYHRELKVEDTSLEDRMAAGNEIGDLAMGLFGEFTEVTVLKEDGRPDISAMIEWTQRCIADGVENICEASFSYPIYFLDFETTQSALPPYVGTKPYVHVLLGKHADTGNVVRNQTAHAGDSAVLTSMYSAMRRS